MDNYQEPALYGLIHRRSWLLRFFVGAPRLRRGCLRLVNYFTRVHSAVLSLMEPSGCHASF